MSRATEEAFERLHTALAEELTEQLKPVTVVNEGESGTTTTVTRASAAIMAVAAKFLKDNGIETPAATSKPTSNLAAQLRAVDEQEGREAGGLPRH